MTKSKKWLPVLVCALAMTVPAQGTRKKDPLASAVIAADYKHDLASAAQIYRSVAADDQLGSDLRTRAWLGLGKVFVRAGKIDDAKQAFVAASEGTGDAAKAAKRILDAGVTQDPDLLKAKVNKLIDQLKKGHAKARTDLVWIGHSAVPYIVVALRKEKDDLTFISSAARTLLDIGGDKALKAIGSIAADKDVLRKRAVLKGLGLVRKDAADAAGVRDLAKFLDDENPLVRRDALKTLILVLPTNTLFARLTKSKGKELDGLMDYMLRFWTSLNHEVSQADTYKKFFPWIARWKGLEEAQGSSLHNSFNNPGRPCFEESLDGQRLFLKTISLPALQSTYVNAHKWKLPEGKKGEPAPFLVEEIMAAARAVGPLTVEGRSRRRTPAQSSLNAFVDLDSLAWRRENIPHLLELVSKYRHQFRYGRRHMVDWINAHMKAEDIPAISKHLTDFDRASTLVRHFLKHKIPADALDGLRKFAEKTIADRRDNSTSTATATCQAILATGSQEAVDYLVSLVRKHGTSKYGLWGSAATHVLTKSEGKAGIVAMRQLLVLEVNDQYAPYTRQSAFNALAQVADKQAIPLYAKAYEMGLPMYRKGMNANAQPQEGLVTIAFERSGMSEWRRRKTSYDDATLAQIFDACLKTKKLRVYQDVWACARYQALPEKVVTVIAAHGLSFPERGQEFNASNVPGVYRSGPRRLRREVIQTLVSRFPEAPGVLELTLKALTSDNERLVSEVVDKASKKLIADDMVAGQISKLVDDRTDWIACNAAQRLFDQRPDVAMKKAEHWIKTHAHWQVRAVVGLGYLAIKKAEGIDLVGPLLSQKGRSGRYMLQLIEKLGSLMDVRAVPFLIDQLRDSNYEKKAKTALEKIKFFHEQRRVWNRIVQNSELTEGTAAEALVKQAKVGNDRKVRLTAIESLGTLGVPETLPFLIKLMTDKDEGIAAAAKKSADRINALRRQK